MVFIIQNIQNIQNRDTAAIHVKLDVIMLDLKVSNAKLHDAENQGEKELENQGERIEREGEDG